MQSKGEGLETAALRAGKKDRDAGGASGFWGSLGEGPGGPSSGQETCNTSLRGLQRHHTYAHRRAWGGSQRYGTLVKIW